MGDRPGQTLRVQFDGKLKLRFYGAKITSDAALLVFLEPDEALRLTEGESTRSGGILQSTKTLTRRKTPLGLSARRVQRRVVSSIRK